MLETRFSSDIFISTIYKDMSAHKKKVVEEQQNASVGVLSELRGEDSFTLTTTAEIKLNWLGDFPGANWMQAAYSPRYFAHDSSYLSLSVGQASPCQVKKAWKAYSSRQLA